MSVEFQLLKQFLLSVVCGIHNFVCISIYVKIFSNQFFTKSLVSGGESNRRKIMNGEKYDFENRVPSEGRHKANQRERVRTYSVNTAFTMLRNLIPTDPADRKLSKIETLRLACSYISHLGSILMTGSCEVSKSGKFICTFCVTAAKIKTDLYYSILN